MHTKILLNLWSEGRSRLVDAVRDDLEPGLELNHVVHELLEGTLPIHNLHVVLRAPRLLPLEHSLLDVALGANVTLLTVSPFEDAAGEGSGGAKISLQREEVVACGARATLGSTERGLRVLRTGRLLSGAKVDLTLH